MKTKANTRVRVEVVNNINDGAPASEPTWNARIVEVETGRTVDHREVAADWGGTGTWFQARKEAAEAREKLAKRGYEVVEAAGFTGHANQGDTKMTATTKTVTVRLLHESSIPGARWCEPIGWEPSNEIEGAEFADGSYWDETEEVAGFVCFADGCKEDEIEVSLGDLRIASYGECKVIGEVKL